MHSYTIPSPSFRAPCDKRFTFSFSLLWPPPPSDFASSRRNEKHSKLHKHKGTSDDKAATDQPSKPTEGEQEAKKAGVDAKEDAEKKWDNPFLPTPGGDNLKLVDKETALRLTEDAHRVCPYSNATRGNIEVKLAVV